MPISAQAADLDQPQWAALKILLQKIDKQTRQQRNHLLMKVAHWFLAIELFRDFEDSRLILATPEPRDLEHHRGFLTQLLAWGETLLIELRQHREIDPESIGLRKGDVEACVHYLRDCYAQWYTDLSQRQKEAILQECFGEEPSTE